MIDLPRREAHIEWRNWKELVGELKKLGIEINDQDALAEAIKKWAFSFVDLKTK